MAKKKAKVDDKQSNLFGEVDDLYNRLSVQESDNVELLEAAERRLASARENLDEARAGLVNIREAMAIVRRRRDELAPAQVEMDKKVEVVVDVKKPDEKAKVEGYHGTRPRPKGKPPKPTPPPPKAKKSDDKK